MTKFILGYPFDTEVAIENLKEYPDKNTADFEAEEWCEVEAETLDDAKQKYENAFTEWQKQQGCYYGD